MPTLVHRLLLLIIAVYGCQAQALRVVVISDLNGSYGSDRYDARIDRAIARTIALAPDLVISTGDMVAGQRPSPHLKRAQLETMWQAFHLHVTEPLAAAGIPLAVTPGNHDASAYPSYALERRIYAEQWQQRRPALNFVDQADYPLEYAFVLGDVLFVAVDATRVGKLSADHRQRLATLLADQGGQQQRRVLFSHLPLWPVAQGREREALADSEFEQMLAAANVELYLSGHHHSWYPGFKDGIAQLSQACLGAGPRRLIGSAHRSQRAITVLDFNSDGSIDVQALSGAHYDQAIDVETLPPTIPHPGGELQRLDRVPSAATAVKLTPP